MVGTAPIVETLMLIAFVRAGVGGEGAVSLEESGYDVTFPCEKDIVCFHVWKMSRSKSQTIAIISNGEIQRLGSEVESCSLRMEGFTTEDVGRHRCQRRSNGAPSMTYDSDPELKLLPGRAVSLQCVLLSFVENAHCFTSLQRGVGLAWVDEAGAEIQADAQHRITRRSGCDVTMTLAFQRPESGKFRCQATVNTQVKTSVELWVRTPAPKGKGRGLGVELEPESRGGNQDTIGAAVGVAGCVVLAAAVAVFVLNRRRTNDQLPAEPCSDQSSTIDVMNTDDVIYADIIFPGGSDRVWVQDCESTEYSCVR